MKSKGFHDFKAFFDYPKAFPIFLKLFCLCTFTPFIVDHVKSYEQQQSQHISLGVTTGNSPHHRSDQ